MDLTAIIVNYNGEQLLSQCLASVFAAGRNLQTEVIVVDNASSDGSVALIRNRFPAVTLICNPQNRGFGAANNQAFRKASGRFVLCLNPDTAVSVETFTTAIGLMTDHPQIGILGLRLLDGRGRFYKPCRRGFPTPLRAVGKMLGLDRWFPNSPRLAGYNLLHLPQEGTYPVDAVSGSFMFIRRQALDAVGGFDEDFFMYGEDLDLCYRFKRRGWQVWYSSAASVIHYGSQSTDRRSQHYFRHFYGAMRIFIGKHHRGWARPLLMAGVGLTALLGFFANNLGRIALVVLDLLGIQLGFLLAHKVVPGGAPTVFDRGAATGTWIVSLYLAEVYTSRRDSKLSVTLGLLFGSLCIGILVWFGWASGGVVPLFVATGFNLVMLNGYRYLWRTVATLRGVSPTAAKGPASPAGMTIKTRPVGLFVKRTFDFAASGLLLLALFPAWPFYLAGGRWQEFRSDRLAPLRLKRFNSRILNTLGVLWRVVAGRASIVGMELQPPLPGEGFLPGQVGLFSAVTLAGPGLSEDQKKKIRRHYLEHWSMLEDLRIVFKSLFFYPSRQR